MRWKRDVYIIVITTAIRHTLHTVIAFLSIMTKRIYSTLPIIIVIIEREVKHVSFDGHVVIHLSLIAYDSRRPVYLVCGMRLRIKNTGHEHWKDMRESGIVIIVDGR